MTLRRIVLLHGVGGIIDVPKALDVLNDHLASRGYPRVLDSDVIAVDYSEILSGAAPEMPAQTRTWRGPADAEQAAARDAYVRRSISIRARLERTVDDRDSFLVVVPEAVADVASRTRGLAKAHTYATSVRVQRNVRRAILGVLPSHGEVILVGYSLGSVIAVDLIPYLPPAVAVRALITVASPLGFVPRMRERSELMRSGDRFPFSRVQAWTNLYSPTDKVTGGRGIAHYYPWASDASIDASAHGLREHLNHPATLEVFEEALHGTYLPAPVTAGIHRPLANAWLPQLLAFAWSQRLGDALAGDDERVRRNLRAARFEVARRSVEAFQGQLALLDTQIADAGELDPNDEEQLRVLRHHPSIDELMDHPGELLAGRIPDEPLIQWLVPVVRSWPVAPFQAADHVSWEKRQQALESLLARVRSRDPSDRLFHSDKDLARLAVQHIRAAEKDMAAERSGAAPWWAVAGLGALALVAVPLTFGAAIPTGLTGAAALTAGLAAFGPGGMAGGIATIALLTGGGALLAGTGASRGLGEQDYYDRRLSARRMARSARELRGYICELPLPELREALIALLAVIRIDEALGGAPRTSRYAVVQQLVDRMRADAHLHQELAPNSDAAKDRMRRLKDMERFAAFLRPEDLAKPMALEAQLRAMQTSPA